MANTFHNPHTIFDYFCVSGISGFQESIDNIMDNFRFDRVATAMAALEWHWAMNGGRYEVPDEAEIRSFARGLIKRAITDAVTGKLSTIHLGTGGFYVDIEVLDYDTDDMNRTDWHDNVNNQVMISLNFQVDSWSNIC